ncbi:exonuclease SbcD [Pyrococcus furiosus DSM 3638]|uniref:Calcineurin-like phosphoesterase domain-containing protein n=3 Tax=Pyrococcus furiosus TaxID=2261 RepID=Q8U231_PYRFU|nr:MULTISPECIES: metallophosphoesterase [Pyrococcus]AAL81143.1 hypothetical protein PF1019 [Pyrococcus furiosus DSM 3638]AFN03815.1 hypothetical protein PFC_04330 [Pyrococcus furiosus COM1]MDK2868855.1 uncharacterized protein [Pyrococcus sp.]QEK78682.1 exonuclease SbcD [Pyrococcus furiosus DSM 3638]
MAFFEDFSLYSLEFETSLGKTLIFADPHLGFEIAKGVRIRSRLEEKLANFIKSKNPDAIIILGDIKEEIGLSSFTRKILMSFFLELKDYIVIITKGNHDGRIEEVTKNFDNINVVEYYLLDDVLFFHGHKVAPPIEFKIAFLGHAHPVIYVNVKGIKKKAKCFIKAGRYVVLPTINPFYEGIETKQAIKMIPTLKEVKTVDVVIPPGIYLGQYTIDI